MSVNEDQNCSNPSISSDDSDYQAGEEAYEYDELDIQR